MRCHDRCCRALADPVFLGIREIDPASLKIFVDFTMDVSYGLVAFSWLVIVLRGDNDAVLWTIFLFGGWLAVAFGSQYLPAWTDTVTTVRHMTSSNMFSMIAVIAGYTILAAMKETPGIIVKIFGVSCLLGFFMEFALWASGIRPSGLDTVFYDMIILINQGGPFIYIIVARIVPAIAKLPRIIGIDVKGEFTGIQDDFSGKSW